MIAYTKTIKSPEGDYTTVTHLYSLSMDGSDRAIYTPAVEISNSQKSKRGVKYNANMTVQEMASVETDEERVNANASLNSDFSSNTFDTSNMDASVPSDIDTYFADFGGFLGGVDMESAMASLESMYREEDGQAELDNELC